MRLWRLLNPTHILSLTAEQALYNNSSIYTSKMFYAIDDDIVTEQKNHTNYLYMNAVISFF